MKKLLLTSATFAALVAPATAADLARPVYRRPVVVISLSRGLSKQRCLCRFKYDPARRSDRRRSDRLQLSIKSQMGIGR